MYLDGKLNQESISFFSTFPLPLMLTRLQIVSQELITVLTGGKNPWKDEEKKKLLQLFCFQASP